MTDPRQRTPAPARQVPLAGLDGEREQVLARRRLALVVLAAAVPITLIAAILTGSTTFLIINLVFDLVIAGYVAMLLQIKQGQEAQSRRVVRKPLSGEDVRVGRR